ncbi:MAG: hypothetical protein U0359_26935 [Byssovorax sp.]
MAMVPELPTAGLAVLGLGALVSTEEVGRRRIWGGVALLLAALSRYEVWPIGVGFALISLWDLRRFPGERRAILGGAVLAVLGPVLWMVWNAHAHGDALHFLARVTAYRRALGGNELGVGARLWAYPQAFVREEPELLAVVGVGVMAAVGLDRKALREAGRRLVRPWGLFLVQVAVLSVSMVKDGAPTHHPERALLVGFLLAAITAGELLEMGLAQRGVRRIAVVVGVLGVVALVAVGVRSGPRNEGFLPRVEETAIGQAAQGVVPRGERVLLEVTDYGFLAVTAAFGRPEDVVEDRSIDPRDPVKGSSFGEAGSLGERVRSAGVSFVIGRKSAVMEQVLGAPVAEAGSFGLFRAQAGSGGAR